MDKTAAVQTIRRLAVQFQGMVEAADALEQIASLEQHEAEVRARLALLQADEAKAHHTLAVVEQAARDADAKKQATHKQTLEEAQTVIDATATQAHAILEDARAHAKGLIEGAAAVNEMQAAALAQLKSETEGVRAQIAQDVKDALESKAAVESETAAAQAKLDAIRQRIADIANA